MATQYKTGPGRLDRGHNSGTLADSVWNATGPRAAYDFRFNTELRPPNLSGPVRLLEKSCLLDLTCYSKRMHPTDFVC